ncbi:MAG TPA: hypothetical protein VF493_13685 [Terriglobales bacterium]
MPGVAFDDHCVKLAVREKAAGLTDSAARIQANVQVPQNILKNAQEVRVLTHK